MNLQLVILRTLKLVHPRLMTTGTLWSEVLMEAPGTTYSAYREALICLEEKGQVVCVTGEDRDRVKLTDAGVARIRENTI
jgi:hypothetical protein